MDRDSHELRAAIRAAQRGDESAFATIVQKTEDAIYRTALSILGCREDAEDAASETLVKLWRTLPEYRFECPLLPYVLIMTRHTALDYLRKRESRIQASSLQMENENGQLEEIDIADTDIAANPVASFERAETVQAVRNAIAELPQEEREILQLREFEQLPYRTIAELLHMEEGTVKSRLFRARQKLATVFLEKNGNYFS